MGLMAAADGRLVEFRSWILGLWCDGGPAVVPGGRGFHWPRGSFLLGGTGSGWSEWVRDGLDGLEPSASPVSGARSYLVSYRPLAKGEGADSPGFPLPVGSGHGAAPAAHLPWRMAEVTLPSPCGAHPGSSRGLRLGNFTIHERRTENSNLSNCLPSRLPTGARALTGSFSKRKASGSNARGTPAPTSG